MLIHVGNITQIDPCLPRSTCIMTKCHRHLSRRYVGRQLKSFFQEWTEWPVDEEAKDEVQEISKEVPSEGHKSREGCWRRWTSFFGGEDREDMTCLKFRGNWMDESLLIWILKQSWELPLDQDKGSASRPDDQCFVLQFIFLWQVIVPALHIWSCIKGNVWTGAFEESYPEKSGRILLNRSGNKRQESSEVCTRELVWGWVEVVSTQTKISNREDRSRFFFFRARDKLVRLNSAQFSLVGCVQDTGLLSWDEFQMCILIHISVGTMMIFVISIYSYIWYISYKSYV